MSENNKKGILERITNYTSSTKGRILFNFFYGFGASLAILGSLFKLLVLPGANVMLSVGLITESIIFALSAFEAPFKLYKWDKVFPALEDEDKDNKEAGKTIQINGNINTVFTSNQNDTPYVSGNRTESNAKQTVNPVANITEDQAKQSYGLPPQVQLTDRDAATLSNSIKVMGEAVGQLNNMAEIAKTTEKYLNQLDSMTSNLNRFSDATSSLAEVSNILLGSYKNITENSEEISNNSKGYVDQMSTLNKNLVGLNTIYEIQLKSVSSQIDTIDRVNTGIKHIRDMYEGSMSDSDKFQKETEEMAKNIEQLNKVYSRMLIAMNPSTGFTGNSKNND